MVGDGGSLARAGKTGRRARGARGTGQVLVLSRRMVASEALEPFGTSRVAVTSTSSAATPEDPASISAPVRTVGPLKVKQNYKIIFIT